MSDLSIYNNSAGRTYTGFRPTMKLAAWNPITEAWDLYDGLDREEDDFIQSLFAIIKSLNWGDPNKGDIPTITIELK